MSIIYQLAADVAYLLFLFLASPWLVYRWFRGKNRRGWRQKLLGISKQDVESIQHDRGLSSPSQTGQLVKNSESGVGAPPQSLEDSLCSERAATATTDADPARQTRQLKPTRFWFHAVSVGEVNLLAPIFKLLQQEYQGNLELILSTTTETGFDLAQSRYPSLSVIFMPFDFSWSVRRTLRSIGPSMIVLTELELWPNLISIANELGIPVVVINGRLSERSLHGYRRFRWLTRRLFRQLTAVGAQNQTYADRFVQCGCAVEAVQVTGSIKFDGAMSHRENHQTQSLTREAGFEATDFVLVAGSTQLEEDLLLTDVYLSLKPIFPQLRLVLVPRHPDRCDQLMQRLSQREFAASGRPIRRTNLRPMEGASARVDIEEFEPVDFLVVDVIGELGAWWGRADAGYVGGSMGDREGQSMIEPAAFGIPVCFGPRTRNFREVVEQLLAENASQIVHDQSELEAFVRWAIEQPDRAHEMGKRAQRVVQRNQGATAKTWQLLDVTLQRAKPV